MHQVASKHKKVEKEQETSVLAKRKRKPSSSSSAKASVVTSLRIIDVYVKALGGISSSSEERTETEGNKVGITSDSDKHTITVHRRGQEKKKKKEGAARSTDLNEEAADILASMSAVP